MTLEVGYFFKHTVVWIFVVDLFELRTNLLMYNLRNKGNNKITELRTILQRESQNS
jgi:hypothetical protein